MVGLALIQPNALVALVLFALVWFVTARLRAALLRHVSWWIVARDLAIVAVVVRRRPARRPGSVDRPGLDPVLRVEGPGLRLDGARRGRRGQAADIAGAVGPRGAHRPRHRLDRRARTRRPSRGCHVGGLHRPLRPGGVLDDVMDLARHGLLVQRQGAPGLARGRARRRPRRGVRACRARPAAQGAAAGGSARRGRPRRGARHPAAHARTRRGQP